MKKININELQLNIYENEIFMMTTHDDRAAEDHIDNLNQRIFFMESSRDESLGSLLFFSCLQDEKLIPSLQQLMLQIKNLKGNIFSS